MLAIVPIPGYDCYLEDGKSIHLLSEVLVLFMFVRFYFILQTCLFQCEYADAFSMRISKSHGFESAGVSYNIKCLYISDPQKTLGSIFLGTICIFASIIRIAEMPYSRAQNDGNFDSYFTSIYFTMITLSTIGYGDICPGTKIGQILVILFAMWGTVLLSAVVGAAMSVFDLNE